MANRVLKYKKGLTLLEVVVSVSILMIILTPILSMVYSTVKTNKDAENRQKAQALIQKYTEDIKAKEITDIILGESVYNDDNFQVNVKVSKVSGYNFPTSTTAGSINIDDYDMKITMDSESFSVYGKDGSKLQSSSITGNKIITVIDNTSKLGVVEGFNTEDSLDIIASPIIKLNSAASKVKVELSSDYTLSIHGKNNSSTGSLTFYCSKSDSSKGHIYIINDLGSIKSLYNISQDLTSNTSASRIYKIDVKVYKNTQFITSGVAYKAALD